MTAWRDFPWWTEPDPGPLCVGDRRHLDCRVEGADFTTGTPSPTDELVVCAYNVERGRRLNDQLDAFTGASGMPAPDVLLLSEADRGCTRSGDRNVAREYAEALHMRYVYGVEFVELPRRWGPGGPIRRCCEHGNAILSRYPLGNVRLLRHQRARSWYSFGQRLLRVGQPRYGRRMALVADMRVAAHVVRLYAVHFESGRLGLGPWSRSAYRCAQARELVADAADATNAVVIGGDMNVLGYVQADHAPAEPTVRALLDAGFADAHAALPADERITTDDGHTIDLIVGRGVRFTEAGVAPRRRWAGLSDHVPVWTRAQLGVRGG